MSAGVNEKRHPEGCLTIYDVMKKEKKKSYSNDDKSDAT